jgi:hypothetical protein
MTTNPEKHQKKPEMLKCFPNVSINTPGNCLPFDTQQVQTESFLTNRDSTLRQYDNVSTCTEDICQTNKTIEGLDQCNNLRINHSLLSQPRSESREMSTTHILFSNYMVNEGNKVNDRISIDSRRVVSDILKKHYPSK